MRLGTDADAVGAARDVLNVIASLPWPRPERLSLFARAARTADADVGLVLSGLALDAAPVESFDLLDAIPGLGPKRLTGLIRALSRFDVTALRAEGAKVREAWATAAGLRGENAVLRAELDRLRAASPPPPEGGTEPPAGPAIMRIADVAASVGTQVTQADDLLRTRAVGLRLGGVSLSVRGTGTSVDGDLALDVARPAGGSAVGISFVPAAAAGRADVEIDVPDVTGYTTALAQRKLAALGFTVVVASMAGATGVVDRQSPPAGMRVRAGSVIRLIVR
jgi:hypothetical protein